MNVELVNKYKRALDLANSNDNLHQYIQLIRETLYKLLQEGYVATIDEVVWAECFIRRDFYNEEENSEEITVLKPFTTKEWENYTNAEKFKDGSEPSVATKILEDGIFTVVVDGCGIRLIVQDAQSSKTKNIITKDLHKRFSIAIGNEICIAADKCLIIVEAIDVLKSDFDIQFD